MMTDLKNNDLIPFQRTLALYDGSVNEVFSVAQQVLGPSSKHSGSLLQAQSDIEAIRSWLAQYLDSPNTFNSYRKEAERLLLWMEDRGLSKLADLKHEDWVQYRYFLLDPKPHQQWVMPQGSRLPRHHPQWRPFAGPLSHSSVQQALTILNSMLQWLLRARYLTANALSIMRYQRTQPSSESTLKRYIPRHLWQEVLSTIEQLPKNTPLQFAHYHRYRWLFSLLYGTGIRVSELCAHTMGDFHVHYDHKGQARWWLHIIGKGRKQRTIPIPSTLMAELGRYRESLGLDPTPTATESMPLIVPFDVVQQVLCTYPNDNPSASLILNNSRPLTRASIHRLVKEICQKTAMRLRIQGTHHEREAQLLEHASPHWIRHTAGTHMVENDIDILHIRDTFGHSSLQTTNRYLHTAETQRHEHTEQKHTIDWPASIPAAASAVPPKD